MVPTYSEIDREFRALVEGHLFRRDDVLQALIDVTQGIWSGRYVPELSPAQLDGTGLSRFGYLLETIKLFTQQVDTCRMLDTHISAALALARHADDAADRDFLPAVVQPGLVDARDELAKFWGLRSGVKVHRIPGFLGAYFEMRDSFRDQDSCASA